MIRVVESDDDIAELIAIRERVDAFTATTVADQRVFRAQANAPLQLVVDGVAHGVAWRFPGERDADLDVGVVPERRREGIGSAVYERLVAHAREQRWETLLAAASEDEGVRWLERRGFEHVDRQERVALQLPCDNLPQATFGGAITDLAARPDLAGRLFELGNEALDDVPGALAADSRPSFESWLEGLRAPSRRPDFFLIALDGDEPVGRAQLNVYPRVGYHELTAVARSHRRRGVARALKVELIRRAQALGLERLLTQSNEDNVAMRALNAELGYEPAPPRIFMRRSV